MILFDLTAVFLLLFLFLFSFANPEDEKHEEQLAPLLVSRDTSTEYDLAPTLREFCGGYGLANFRALKIRYQLIESPILLFIERLTDNVCTDDKTFLQSPISTFEFRWRGNYEQRQDDQTIESYIKEAAKRLHGAALNYFWSKDARSGKQCTFRDRRSCDSCDSYDSCEGCESCEFSLANVTELVEYHKWYAEDYMNETLGQVIISPRAFRFFDKQRTFGKLIQLTLEEKILAEKSMAEWMKTIKDAIIGYYCTFSKPVYHTNSDSSYYASLRRLLHHRLFSTSGIAINPEEDATLIQEFVLKAGKLLDNVSRGIFVKTAKMYKEEDLLSFIPMFDALLSGENVEFENYILQFLKFAQTEPFLKLVNEYRRSICLAPIDIFRRYLIPSLKELISDGVVRCSWTSCFKNKQFQLGEILRHILEKWNDIESTKTNWLESMDTLNLDSSELFDRFAPKLLNRGESYGISEYQYNRLEQRRKELVAGAVHLLMEGWFRNGHLYRLVMG